MDTAARYFELYDADAVAPVMPDEVIGGDDAASGEGIQL